MKALCDEIDLILSLLTSIVNTVTPQLFPLYLCDVLCNTPVGVGGSLCVVSVDEQHVYCVHVVTCTTGTARSFAGAEKQAGVSIGCHSQICLKGAQKSKLVKICVCMCVYILYICYICIVCLFREMRLYKNYKQRCGH